MKLNLLNFNRILMLKICQQLGAVPPDPYIYTYNSLPLKSGNHLEKFLDTPLALITHTPCIVRT